MPSTLTAKSECEHHVFYGIECAGEAVFVLRRHEKAHPICRAVANYIFANGRTRCYECKQPIWKCWTTEPIR
jgi:hypothetical protein